MRNEPSMQTLPIELPLLPVSDQGRGARWAKPGWAPPPSAAGSPLHEKFYSTWHMPDRPSVSCCNDADCYPTEIKYVEGNIYAKRREDGKYILIPPEQVERNKDNPDGRNHIYAPPPNAFHPSDTVLCFALGGAPHEIRIGRRKAAAPAMLLCDVQSADRSKLLARKGRCSLTVITIATRIMQQRVPGSRKPGRAS
jgi:hypothetical protein